MNNSKSSNPLHGLSCRAANSIENVARYRRCSVETVRREIATGQLDPTNFRGIGPVTRKEIIKWSTPTDTDRPIPVATSYTKDYNGTFFHKGPLVRVNLTAHGGKEIAQIDADLLATLMHDIGRDLNTPHLIQEARRILHSDAPTYRQLDELRDLLLPKSPDPQS